MYISEPVFWFNNLRDLIWWRNHVVAPLSEEFTFRACMLPALLQCFQPITAVFICPLFFGVGMCLSVYIFLVMYIEIQSIFQLIFIIWLRELIVG